MRRAWGFGLGALGLGVAVGFSATAPNRALDAEKAAARREGLLTSLSEVRPTPPPPAEGDNAASAIRSALQEDRRRVKRRWDVEKAARKSVGGTASAREIALLRAALAADPEFLPRWRAASARPRLWFDADWTDKTSPFRAETVELDRVGATLAAAAKLGIQPRENLVAAARLSALLRQDPAIDTQRAAVRIGLRALEAARSVGLAEETEAALGPPPDLRLALAAELPMELAWMEMLRTEEGRRRFGGVRFSARDRFGHVGPLTNRAEADVIRRWRAMWRDLPADPQDYAGALKTLNRDAPTVQAALLDYSDQFENTWGGGGLAGEYTELARAFERLQAARETARKAAHPLSRGS